MTMRLFFCIFLFFPALLTPGGAQGICAFDETRLEFAGSKIEQARCLLSPVGRYARVDGPLTTLPPTLQRILTSDLGISQDQMRTYIEHSGFSHEQVGGSLTEPLARAVSNSPQAPQARYMVIHDTSWPYLRNDPFPTDLDTGEFVNTFNYYVRSPGREVAHAFVNRRGEIFNQLDFGVPWRATKFELNEVGTRSRGLFLHVELVQPRRRQPGGGSNNDALAPNPGFTEAQYKWLALLYVSASVRRGDWIVPAYHAVLDNHIPGGHDDPQNFDLDFFDSELAKLISSIEAFSADNDLGEGRAAFSLRTTNYYLALQGDYAAGEAAAFTSPTGSVLARVSDEFLAAAEIEGSAKLDDGRVFNFHSRVDGQIRWSQVNAAFGLGANNCPLVPLRSVAVDPSVLPLNSLVRIGETIGMPDGNGGTHDGLWYAIDVGSAIEDDRIDLFTGAGSGSMDHVYGHGIEHLQALTVTLLETFENCPTRDG